MIHKYLNRLVPELQDDMKPAFRLYRKQSDDGQTLVLSVPSLFRRAIGIYDERKLKYYPSALVRNVWMMEFSRAKSSWVPRFKVSRECYIVSHSYIKNR